MLCDCAICSPSADTKKALREMLLSGRTEYALVQSLNDARSFSTDTSGIYRGKVKILSTGGIQDCDFTPSPYGGVMPREGDLVLVYRKSGYFCQFLEVISTPVLTEKKSLEDRTAEATPSPEIPVLTKGEQFIGLDARLSFDDQGGSSWSTRSGSLAISLNNSIKEVLIQGFNFEMFTPGNGIRIRTESSIPNTFGDMLRIEKNIPIPVIPPELGSVVPVPIPSNISLFQIDSLGGISLSAITDSASIGLSEYGVAGYAYMKNQLCHMTLNPTGSVSLGNVFGTLTIDAPGSLELSSPLASLKQDVLGVQRLTGKNVELFATDLVGVTSLAAFTVSASTALFTVPLTTFTGNVVYSAAGGSVSTSVGPMNLVAPSYTVTSPNTAFTGIVSIQGLFKPSGTPASIPLTSQTAIALIPVMVNGVIVGNIPVIP